jgi:hypothetical protein
MEEYTQEDLFTARTERDHGIKIAVDHADDIIPKWSDQALAFVGKYCEIHENCFVTNELREWAEQNGLPEPPTRMAWGSVMVQAKKKNLIEKMGFTQGIYPDRPNTHMQTVTMWRSNDYGARA